MNELPDGQLLQAFSARSDEAAFAELLRRHGGTVQRAAQAVVGQSGLADDIAQATFLSLARKADRFKPDAAVGAWLHRVTVCLARNARRDERRRAGREREAARVAAPAGAAPAISAAALAALHEELGNLAERDRASIVLHHLEGRSYTEAAAALGCSQKAFSVRLTRAREKLRQRLVKRGVVLGAGAVAAGLESSATGAELPAAFVAATCKAASALAAGKNLATGGLVSAQVAALTQGALKMLFWTKVKTLAAVAAVVVILVGGAVALAGEQSKPERAESPKPVADGNGKTGKQDAVAGGEVVKNLQLVLSVDKVKGGSKKPRFTADMIECVPGEPLAISFTVAVVNRGTTPLKIMDHWATGRGLRLVAPAGREIQEIKDYPFVEGSFAGPTAKDVKELAPGEKITYTERLNVQWDPEDKEHPGKALIFYAGGGIALDISKPGTYGVIANYWSDDAVRSIAKESKLDIWDGKVSSNAVELLVTGMGAPRKATAGPTPDDLKALAAGNNRLALDLYAKLREKEKGNLFFSPYSIRTALAMTYAGARGETAAQMQKALHYTSGDATLHAAFAESIRTLNAGGQKNYELAVANSLWGEQSHPFLAPFVELTRTCYGGGLERVDFKTAAEPARLKINGWVEGRTKQKIKDLIPPGGVTADTRLVLVNAVYFKGLWAVPFDKKLTQDAPFHLAGGQTVPAPLMTFAEAQKFPFFAGDGFKLLELAYQGRGLSLVVILPDATSDLATLEAKLDEASLTKWLAGLRSQKVQVHLPRFKLTWGTKDLGTKGLAVLPALGMPLPFDDQQADFSGMDGRRPAGAGGLYIGAVFHKAFVDVYEEGTEAAAATAVVMFEGGLPAPPPVFRADRPFLFLIREKATGSILFLGRVTNPVAP